MIGKTISHYKILEKLGEGGMGVVYKAEDTKLKRIVALKFLPTELTKDEEAKKRFIHEAQAVSALDHQNICNVHEIDQTEDGQIFICMGYYEGENLKKKIDRGLLKVNTALDYILQIAQGLTKAHQRKIVHRDIKSSNIIVTSDDVVKIVDFGLAKLTGMTRLTKTGSTVGTIAYMSPEQARGDDIDNRTDIWSMGVILYEMITGQLPFKGNYEQAIVYSILNENVEPVTGIRSGLPMELERIINKCLGKNPSDRYQSTEEFIVDINRLKKDIISITQKSIKIPKEKSIKKKIISFLIPAFVVIIICIIGYIIFYKPWQEEKIKTEMKTANIWDASIAVLPFTDLSPQKDQEYFCDGMLEDIITNLSRIQNMKVISRTSILRYRNAEKDIREIGNELGVGTILEGSIRKEKDKIRVSAQLINIEDGFHLWAETYDKKLESVFDVQDDISKSIAEALKIELFTQRTNVGTTIKPKNIDAYDYYLKGMYFIKSKYVITFDEEDFNNGLKMFQKAIEIDSNYSLAYFGLGWAYEHHYHITGSKEDSDNMLKASEMAYRLDPNSALMNAVSGYYHYEYKRDYDAAFNFFKKALKINPNIAEVNFLIGVCYLYHGLYNKALEYLYRAYDLDPFYFWTPNKIAMCHMNIGEFGKAEIYFDKYFELAPVIMIFPSYPIALYAKMRKFDKVEKLLEETEKIRPNYWGIAYGRALLYAIKGEKDSALALYKNSEIYSLLGMKDEAIESLNNEIRKSVQTPYAFYYVLINNPFYDNIKNDSRFIEMQNKEKKIYDELLIKYESF